MLKCIACLSLLLLDAAAEPQGDHAMWQKFKAEHGKTYVSNGEDADHFKSFIANVDLIKSHNARATSYELGLNSFADLSAEEFAAMYIGGYRPEVGRIPGLKFSNASVTDIPESTDWVSSGAVTAVKNQGSCGSCWAFSTTGAVEGALFVASQQLISLSEEELVECDKGDLGCRGGIMERAFDWASKNGLCAEDSYPYSAGGGRAGVCHISQCQPVVKVDGFVDVTSKDETALQAAVAQQPVSVAIEADRSSFQLYRRGVLDNPACGQNLDHGVLAVGYGTDNGIPYWKVKNSWGPSWGEQGYIRIARGKNMCGIATQPSYPTGAKLVGPAPGPSPPPGPAPPAPTTHYADPKNGCMDDEEPIRIQGVEGGVCAAHCSYWKRCPSDEPTGATAKPTCALSSPQGNFCALLCNPAVDDDQCGEGASCKAIASTGICTYDDDAQALRKTLAWDPQAASEIVI